VPIPQKLLLQDADKQLVRQAQEEFREVLILRELEGMSYKEISDITSMPPGTVMSSLSRARNRLRQSLSNLAKRDASPGSASAMAAGR
jgi:RNA polymerase sigma factor (sigma-70 family)